MTENYLLRIRAENCPKHIVAPKEKGDWEGQIVLFESKRKKVKPPQKGDILYVWVMDGDEGSRGLTAKCTIGNLVQLGNDFEILLSDVELFKKGYKLPSNKKKNRLRRRFNTV